MAVQFEDRFFYLNFNNYEDILMKFSITLLLVLGSEKIIGKITLSATIHFRVQLN